MRPELIQTRIDKIARLRELGVEPYPTNPRVEATEHLGRVGQAAGAGPVAREHQANDAVGSGLEVGGAVAHGAHILRDGSR